MNLSIKVLASTAALCAVAMVGCGNDKGKDNSTEADSAKSVAESQAAENAADDADGIAADVAPALDFADEDVLVEAYGTKMTFADAAKVIKRMLKAQGAGEEQVKAAFPQIAPRALPQICEQFVVTAALKDAAAKAGFKCEDADVKDFIDKLSKRLPEGKNIDEAFVEMGTTREEAEKEIAEGVPVNKLFESLCKDCAATDADVAAFYGEHPEYFETPARVRASHILIKVDDATNEVAKAEAKAKIEGLLKQIKDGADFAELAKANSDCPSKEQGGDLGFFGKGQMVPQFEAAAFALSTNEVSDVIETRFGFHVIKLTGREEAGKIPLEEVASKIKENLEGEKKSKIVDEYVRGIVKQVEYKANDKLSLFPKDEEPEEEESAAVVSEPVEIPAAKAETAPAPAAEAAPAPAAEAK